MLDMHRDNHRGFTLIEVLVVAPIVLLVIGIFVTVVVSLTGRGLEARGANTVIYETNAAIAQMKHDISFGNAFLVTNSIQPLISPQGVNDNTANFTNSEDGTFIIETFATYEGNSIYNRTLVWLKNRPFACSSPDVTQNDPMSINVIYFLKESGGTNALWRRTIMPANYQTAGCTTPTQRPSCSPDQTATICAARDVKVLDSVTDFTIDYYTSPTAATKLSSPTSQSTLNIAKTVKINLEVDKIAGGHSIGYQTSFQSTRLNN